PRRSEATSSPLTWRTVLARKRSQSASEGACSSCIITRTLPVSAHRNFDPPPISGPAYHERRGATSDSGGPVAFDSALSEYRARRLASRWLRLWPHSVAITLKGGAHFSRATHEER